jgi:hypothetical protein
MGAAAMRKTLAIGISILAALSVAGCACCGKAPTGKGKVPVVETRG